MTEEGREAPSGFVAPPLRLELVATAREVLAALAEPSTADPEHSDDPELWRRLSALGWAGISVPERYGALGLGLADLCAVLEEAGRFLLGAPVADTAVFAKGVEWFAPEHAERLLPAVAEGELVGTVAFDSQATVTRRVAGVALAGVARFVPHGARADLLWLCTSGGDEPCLVLVEGEALAAMERRTAHLTDRTRPVAHLTFDLELPQQALVATGRDALRARDRLRAVRAVTLAAECAGGADRALEIATGYAAERRQFGRPIGSFQAVKHKLADMLALVEHARTAARRASAGLDDDHPDLLLHSAVAKAQCGDAFVRVAGDNIQVHGGIGFTWEHPAHLYYKRASVNAQLVWSTSECREFVRANLFD